MKTDEFLNKVKNIINEDNMSELKKELDYLYKGVGWAEWNYFKEGLAYDTNFKPEEITSEDLEKMINASGIAKVEQVKDIKNYSDMEDFDPKDFDPEDKIILTKKPMSNKFYNENLDYNDGDSFYHSRFGRLTYNANNDTFEDTDGDSYDADMIDPEELESINDGMSNRFCGESSQKNESSLKSYKELAIGDTVEITDRNGKQAGKITGIFKNTGTFDSGITIVIKDKEGKSAAGRYSQVRKIAESSQKNEAFGGAEMTFSIEKMIECTEQIVHDISGLVENTDDDSVQEYLDKSRINTDEFETCFETLLDYFEKLHELLLLMDKIDIDDNDGSKWFKPLAQFVKTNYYN